MDLEKQLQEYIIENFMYSADSDELTSELNLLDAGIIDSTGVLEIVGFIEESFEIQVDDEEMIPDHFQSISAMATYIKRKQG